VARLTFALAALLVSGLLAADTASPSSSLTATLTPTAGKTVPQGKPFAFVASVTSQTSFDGRIVFVLSRPGSLRAVPFARENIIVSPGGTTPVKQQSVTPAQWFPELGTFQITPTLDGAPIGPPLELQVTKPEVLVPRFVDVTTTVGVLTSIRSVLPADGCRFDPRWAAGAAWADVNGDRRTDLFVARGGAPARLFINRGVKGFRDEASARGVTGDGVYEVGGTFADVNRDGHADLYVVRDGPGRLYLNDGKGRFTDGTARSGAAGGDYLHTSASFADYDSDGKLDLYLTTYARCTFPGVVGPGQPDELFHGNGRGTFTDVSSLIQPSRSGEPGVGEGRGFQAAWFDYNGDGRQDLYLANDWFGAAPDYNRLWRNDGRDAGGSWRFTDASAATRSNLRINTMGIGVGDYDRDGRLDLALSNIGGNRLLRNQGDGTFADVSDATNMAVPRQETGQASVTWGTLFGDFNLDGWDDLYLAAGRLDLYGTGMAGDGTGDNTIQTQENQTLVNQRGAFLDLSSVSGAGDMAVSRGVATADYDRDGRLDLFVVDQQGLENGTPHLYRNVTPRGKSHWLEVNTIGSRSNRDGCGAKIVAAVRGASLTREVFCGSVGLAGGSDKVVHFGLGPAKKVLRLTVSWPSGVKQVLRNVKPDRLLTVTEPRV